MKTKTGMKTRCSLGGLEAGKRLKDERNKINPTRRQINPSFDSSRYVGVRGQKLPLFQLRCPEQCSYAFTSDRFKYFPISTVYIVWPLTANPSAIFCTSEPKLMPQYCGPHLENVVSVKRWQTQMVLVIHLMSDSSHFYGEAILGSILWKFTFYFHSFADEVWVYLPL